jgi:hypothetical protein
LKFQKEQQASTLHSFVREREREQSILRRVLYPKFGRILLVSCK